MLQDENMPKSKNAALTIHINILESVRPNLMKQLRHNVYRIGNIGIIFLVIRKKLDEYVSYLRDGSI